MKKFIKPLIFLLTLTLIVIPLNPTVSYAADNDIIVEINKENFPDPVFRNFMLNGSHYIWDEDNNQIEVVYDENKDGFLSKGEIANMKQLLTAETYIRDLKGVEYLTSLIEIDCQRSSLNYMDLTSNTELLILNCYKCDLKGALDLSKNTKLEGAACHNNRELTSIDVSGCAELTSLTCDSTGVTELDLSNNPKLQSVSFADTGMTKIDLRNNPELAMISAYNTDITYLDLSANPKLEYLDASNCKLRFLDLSTNPNMLYLNLSNNPLGWVNIGNNPSLECYIDDSEITLKVPSGSFDITKYIPSIDTEKMTIVSGASLQGNIVSDYSFDTPIVYTYDCGNSSAGAEVLTVTVQLGQFTPEITPPVTSPFADVFVTDYYYDSVLWAVDNDITNGVGDGTSFDPNGSCTRAQMVTFLWRASGAPDSNLRSCDFTDVEMDSYYGEAVKWAVENGITNGTGDGTTFSPDETCTRAQMASFLFRMSDGKADGSSTGFNDVDEHSYYAEAVKWAVENGITNGTGDGTTFSPDEICTRAQTVTFLDRLINK